MTTQRRMLGMAVLFVGCGSEGGETGREGEFCRELSWPPQAGEAIVVAQNLPRVMGSFLVPNTDCSARSGTRRYGPAEPKASTNLGFQRAYVPLLPVLNETLTAFILPPKIVKIEADGTLSDFYVFSDDASAFVTGFAQGGVTIGDFTGTVMRGLQMSVVEGAGGDVYVSQSVAGVIYRIDAEGTSRQVFADNLPGVLSLSRSPDGNLYAVTSAVMSDVGEVLAPPIIHLIASKGVVTEYFRFPEEAYPYFTGFARGNEDGSRLLPIGYMIDLAFDSESNVFAVLNIPGVIVKIDASGDLSEWFTDVVGGSGIVIDSDDNVFVTTAPLISDDASGVVSGPSVLGLSPDAGSTVFYDGSARPEYQTGFNSGIEGGYYPIDAVFNLNLDGAGNLYLEDNLANEMTMIPLL